MQSYNFCCLQVLGIPFTEELALRPRKSIPLDTSAQPPPPSALPPNKRQKLSHETDARTDAPAHSHASSGVLDQQQEAEQVEMGKEGEQARVCKVIEVHGASLLRRLNGESEPGEKKYISFSYIGY